MMGEEMIGAGAGDGLTRRSVARESAAETRETPESPQVDLPDSAAIPAPPDDGTDTDETGQESSAP